MFKRILPFVLVAIVLSVVVSVLVATQRLSCPYPALGRFMKRPADLPIEPVAGPEGTEPETAA